MGRKRWVAGLVALLLTPAAAPTVVAPAVAEPAAPIVAAKPYMGWSGWSPQATNYPGVNPNGPASWLTEANVVRQADVMAARLKKHGYTYVNVDAGWHKGFDEYARGVVDPVKFPRGMKWLGDHVHRKGLKLGSYLAVGLYLGAYNNGESRILGAENCHTRDIVYPDLRKTNGWDEAYKINFENPCAQAYIDSVVDLLASWGVDLLKLDGVGPGSFKGGENYDNTEDVKAYRKAIDYVDGSSSRTIVVTVNGVSFQQPMAGSADNDWDRAQRVVVPVRLKAGANTVKFANPNDYAPDIDRITV